MMGEFMDVASAAELPKQLNRLLEAQLRLLLLSLIWMMTFLFKPFLTCRRHRFISKGGFFLTAAD
jgi:hypothetical protein